MLSYPFLMPKGGYSGSALLSLWFFLLFFGIPDPAFGQDRPEYALSLLPDSLLDAGGVVLSEDRTLEIHSAEKMTLRVTRATLILQPSEELEQEAVLYDPDSRVTKLSGAVYSPSGQLLKTYGKRDVRDLAASSLEPEITDMRYQLLTFSHDSYPYVAEVTYEVRLRGFAKVMALQWQPMSGYGLAIREANLRVISPADLEVVLLPVNTAVVPEQLADTDQRVQTVQLTNVPAVSHVRWGPPPGDLFPKVWIFPSAVDLGGTTGSMTDWQQYGTFISTFYPASPDLPDDLRNAVQRELAGAKSPADKIAALYRFMQREMRYVSIQLGVGGWKPLPVDFVYEKKFGDCKALTYYLQSMLGEAGISAYPVLTYRGDRPRASLDNERPTFSFNHVLLYVPEEDLFLECTSTSYPPGFIGSDNENRQALLVKDTGGELIDMPRSLPEENSCRRDVTLTLEPSGAARLSLVEERTGWQQQLLRYLHTHFSPDRQLSYIEDQLLPSGWQIGDWGLEVHPEAPEVQFRMELNARQYGSRLGQRMFLPLVSLSMVEDIPEEDSGRELPFVLRKATVRTDTIHIQIPEGFTVEALPAETFSAGAGDFTYADQLTVREDVIIYVRRLYRRSGELAPEAYEAYRTFLTDISIREKEKIVLVATRP